MKLLAYTYTDYDKFSNPPISTQKFGNTAYHDGEKLEDIIDFLKKKYSTTPPTCLNDFVIIGLIKLKESESHE